jgi:hypothetical protein
VRIRGTSRLEAHAARAGGKLVVSGTVTDDAAHPVPGARVAAGLARGAPPAGVATFAGASPEACSEGGAPPVLDRADLLVLPVDEGGRFCVRLSLPVDRYAIHLESRATPLVDPARLDLAVDLALEPVTLRFDPEPRVVALDDEGSGAAASFDVVASTENDGVTTAAAGLPLTLSNEAGTQLASATTDASGRVRFALEAARLGPPGKGELRVSFGGSSDAGASSQTLQIERRTRVDLAANDAVGGVLPPGSPEDGVVLRARASARCAAHGCAGTPTGTVEARVGDTIVGAAPLAQGEARVVVTFGMPAASEVPLRLRYVPDAPWFQPGGELAITLPVRASSPWRKALLLVAGLAVVGWLVLARFPAAKRKEASARASHAPPLPQAGVELVRSGPAAQGWGGRLHDAHDVVPIAGARVAVERPGFQRVDVLAEVYSDEGGVFLLPALHTMPGDLLVAEGRLHAQLRRPLPSPGELDIALVLRRRAVLDRLVAWARARGRPFDARSEPTPGVIRRAAGQDLGLARWADATERAAYGGAPVDARAQAEVDRLAPGGDGPQDPAPGTPRPPGPGAR